MTKKSKLIAKIKAGLTWLIRFLFKPLKPKQYKYLFKIIGLCIFLASVLLAITLYILRNKGISNLANTINPYLKVGAFIGLWLVINSKDKIEDNRCRLKRAQSIQFIFSSSVFFLILSMMENVNGIMMVPIQPIVFTILITYLATFFIVKHFT